MYNVILRSVRVISWVGAICLSLLGQATITESWQVEDTRPLSKAADLLELKYGLQINYEDPIYQFPGEWQDTGVQGKSSPGLPVATLAWSNAVLSPARRLPDPAAVIQNLIDQHKAASHPGEFKLVAREGQYFILPNRVRDASGQWIPATSPMDTRITLPAADRTAADFVKQFCDTLSQSTGIRVELFDAPINYILQTHTTVGANGETARDVFVRMLNGLQWSDKRIAAQVRTRKLSYKMIYIPAMKEYMLQTHIIMWEVPRPSGDYVAQFAEN
jgi:hypothetical protein